MSKKFEASEENTEKKIKEYISTFDPVQNEDIKEKQKDILVRGRTILIDRWNALDVSSARGPANQALVGFFKKAGYMK